MSTNPNPGRITDEMWSLWEGMQALEPSSLLGGIYANKPGYHNCRSNLPSHDYSVCDRPPDDGGPSDKGDAIDWTFPNAQGGDYSTISKYTNRLLKSAQDPNDPRLDGWREFYGQADSDSYVEGWDIRYGCAATSDSSHLWHLHLSESRDQATSQTNKDRLLSVLRGESVDEWGGDVSAKDVWGYDIDPSSNKYSAGGATWTMFGRTDYLANTFAPSVITELDAIQDQLTATRAAPTSLDSERLGRLITLSIITNVAILVLVAVVLWYVAVGD